MAVIEITTFRLADGADEAAFLDADTRVQTEFIPNHRGFARRTTARHADGTWVVITLWYDTECADASRALAESHPATTAFDSLIDPASVLMERYQTLD